MNPGAKEIRKVLNFHFYYFFSGFLFVEFYLFNCFVYLKLESLFETCAEFRKEGTFTLSPRIT